MNPSALSTDREIAQELVDAVEAYATVYSDGNIERMLVAETAICDRLDIAPDEVEQGLTDKAVADIEAFVSRQIGITWSYA